MKTNICLFEDEQFHNLLPLVYTRPVYDLRCGIFTLREKIEKLLGKVNVLHSRKILQEVLTESNPDCCVNSFEYDEMLLINGRLLANKKIIKEINALSKDSLLKFNDIIIAARLTKGNISKLFKNQFDIPSFNLVDIRTKEADATLIQYPWELVNNNGAEIRNDFSLIVKNNSSRSIKGVEQKNKKLIYISKSAAIDPFVYLDASNGPIYIDKNAVIMSHSFLQGPAFIGAGSTIKAHSKIYHDTSIGPVCKVGGEVEVSIIHSHTNKQHAGFLGHAYLGSWVNIGADTNNSDLKNNYANVAVLINGKNVDTGSQFVGLMMGDHSKTAINTMFNTGTIVGVSCNIFGAGFPPRYIPSFSWGGSDFLRNYDIEKSLEVARVVLARRENLFSEPEEKLFRNIYEATKPERIKKS